VVAGAAAATTDRPVRPTVTTARAEETPLVDLRRDDLVPVSDILTPPPVPRAGLLALVGTLLALLLVAAVGLGEPSRTVPPEVAAGARLTLAGEPVGGESGGPVSADLGEPLRLEVGSRLARQLGATEAELALSAAGLSLGDSGREPLLAGEGFVATQLSVDNLQHLTAGSLTGTVRLYDQDGAEVLLAETEIEPDRAPWTTVITLASLLVLLGVVAYAISVSRPLRAGRRRQSAFVGLPIVGAVAGFGLVLLLWSLGIAPEPVGATELVAVVLGAVAGALAASVAFRFGRRRRLGAAGITA
jgi:hypothetical protein